MKKRGNYVTKSADFLRKIENHLTKVAPSYRKLRTTDMEPILFIERELSGADRMHGADIGCGAGRYTIRLVKKLEKMSFTILC